MKFKVIYTTFVLGLLGLLLLGNSNGRATQANWGNTGAPGDETFLNGNPRTCQSCHNGSTAFQVTLEIDLLDADGNSVLDDGYIPGETYTAQVNVIPVSGTPAGYGFQMVALNCIDCDENADDVVAWSDPANNTKIATANNTNRTYIEHNGVSDMGTFEAKWTAPDSEGVTFYSCGNGVNDDGNSGTGDNAACGQVTVLKAVASSQKNVAGIEEISLFPNPVIETLTLNFEATITGKYHVNIYSMTGRLMINQEHELNAGQTILPLNTSDLENGLYLLQILGEEGQLTKRFLKQ